LQLENSSMLPVSVEIGQRLNGQNVVLLMDEDFCMRTIQLLRLANIGRLNLHRKYVTKCETVAKFNKNVWPSYGVMAMYNFTFSEVCIVIHIHEKNQQDEHFFLIQWNLSSRI
jgi:hypothetical protein